MLKLIEPNEKYLEQYKEAYLESLNQIKLGNLKTHNMKFINPDENDIIQILNDSKDISKLPANYVPSYEFFAVDDDKFIGLISIRTRLTENLIRYGGHIGYGINPKYWKMGYGTQVLKLALDKYNDLIEEDKILITCDDDNVGSYKIIEANRGILENKVENENNGEYILTRRYWIKK